MSIILTPQMGNSGGGQSTWFKEVTYDYDYPAGLKLKPGEKLHDDIVTKLMNYATQSYNVMQRRHASWNVVDDKLNIYITPTTREEERVAADANAPVSIVVPQSFAVMETILTYFVGAFLQDPIFMYEGAGPEDMAGAKLMELLIEYQMRRSQGGLALHTMFRDSITYGFGAVAAGWKKQQGNRIVAEENTPDTGALALLGAGPRKKTVPYIFYEGSELVNIDPYLCLPDPNVPIHKACQGDFFGWVDEMPLVNLLDEEQWLNSDLFNVRYLSKLPESQSQLTLDPSRRGAKFQLNNRRMMYGATNCRTVLHMYVNLIPKDWGLGDSEYPQKWSFAVADGMILIKARPLDLVHNTFPIVMSAPDYDGYSIAPISRIEILSGLQSTLDFLFNSHVTNVRRAVNNMFVVDPSLINMPDFDNPEGGLLVRLRRAAWGRGVGDAVQQLQVSDVTRGHISDGMVVMDLSQKFSGAVENLMGVMRRGSERRSATEAQGVMSSAVGRMEKMARLTSIMALQPLAYMLAFHTQQLMTKDTYVNVVGDYVPLLQSELGPGKRLVSPLDILAEFDVIPRDGSLPTDVQGQGNNWVQLYGLMLKNPVIAAQFDTVKIFLHIARLMGAKNAHQFIKMPVNTQVQPDEQVAMQAQQGNLIPLPQEGLRSGLNEGAL